MHSRSARILIAIVAVAAGGTMAAQGPRPQEGDVLTALLTEVRGLRAAMEQLGSAGPRVQLALGRLQLQEQRVNTMVRRLESVREAIARIEKESAGAESQAAIMAKAFKDGDDNPENNPMSHVIETFKSAIAGNAAEIQRLQSEEAQLQQQIAAEQARWSEINRGLEELEQSLTKR